MSAAVALKTAVIKARQRASSAPRPLIGSHSIAQYWYASHPNAGDTWSRELTVTSLGLQPTWVPPAFDGKLLMVGSIVHAVRDRDIVMGTGSIRDEQINLPRGARVISVRGPLTRRCLGNKVPELYGDPGLLIGDYLTYESKPSDRIGIIAHYVDKETADRAHQIDGVLIIDIRQRPAAVLQQISECRTVVASSLHGIIFAEAIGVPALWVKPHDSIVGGEFKYHDYYLGTGREPPCALSLAEALDRAREQKFERPRIDLQPIRESLLRLQESLSPNGD